MTRGRGPLGYDVRPGRASRRRRGIASTSAWVSLLVVLTGCAGKAPVKDARTSPVSSSAPEPFSDARDVLVAIGRMRDAGDTVAARGVRPRLVASARNLMLMRPPHDLRREDIMRFLDARERFTEAVNGYGRAADGTDDTALWNASRDVEASYWAWYDAYRGRPSEGSI